MSYEATVEFLSDLDLPPRTQFGALITRYRAHCNGPPFLSIDQLAHELTLRGYKLSRTKVSPRGERVYVVPRRSKPTLKEFAASPIVQRFFHDLDTDDTLTRDALLDFFEVDTGYQITPGLFTRLAHHFGFAPTLVRDQRRVVRALRGRRDAAMRRALAFFQAHVDSHEGVATNKLLTRYARRHDADITPTGFIAMAQELGYRHVELGPHESYILPPLDHRAVSQSVALDPRVQAFFDALIDAPRTTTGEARAQLQAKTGYNLTPHAFARLAREFRFTSVPMRVGKRVVRGLRYNPEE